MLEALKQLRFSESSLKKEDDKGRMGGEEEIYKGSSHQEEYKMDHGGGVDNLSQQPKVEGRDSSKKESKRRRCENV